MTISCILIHETDTTGQLHSNQHFSVTRPPLSSLLLGTSKTRKKRHARKTGARTLGTFCFPKPCVRVAAQWCRRTFAAIRADRRQTEDDAPSSTIGRKFQNRKGYHSHSLSTLSVFLICLSVPPSPPNRRHKERQSANNMFICVCQEGQPTHDSGGRPLGRLDTLLYACMLLRLLDGKALHLDKMRRWSKAKLNAPSHPSIHSQPNPASQPCSPPPPMTKETQIKKSSCPRRHAMV